MLLVFVAFGKRPGTSGSSPVKPEVVGCGYEGLQGGGAVVVVLWRAVRSLQG